MKQKQRIAFFGVVAVALILAACDSDSGNNSSESEGDSSSSVFLSSSTPLSSSVEVCTNTYGTNTVTDCRDNQTYKTVVIGTQTWMAENLNYAVDSSWCYESSVDSCAKYGRLYQWASAMGLSATYNTTSASGVISTPQQGVCPVGWHIPTDAEWTTLGNTVGGEDVAGTALKSTNGWYNDGNGTDTYGFSALPAGRRYYYGSFYYVGGYADFWSATEYDTDLAYGWYLGYGIAGMYANYYDEDGAFSVRCLKD